MKKTKADHLIRQLQYASRQELDPLFSYLYQQVYQQVCSLVKEYVGVDEDAEDIFHDGLLALLKMARRGQLAADANVEAYLFSICRNLWYKQLKKRKNVLSLDELPLSIPEDDLPLEALLKKEEEAAMLQYLEALGDNCCKVLVYYYYDRMRLKVIAELMGYASEQVAKNRKLTCMKRLRELYELGR